MDELQRSEYPAMLASLQPIQAAQIVNERLRRIGKTNSEIADWLQERRRVEEQYVAGLKRLLLFKVPNASSELSIFQPSWDKILHSTDAIAASHHLFSQRVDKDVELPLRQFNGRKDVQNMQTMSSNLTTIAKELEDSQEKVEKLSKKGGKASAQKVDAANSRLESASSQWESQAPFILETMQALDEQRCNHLRDVLTQLQTHEVDQADRLRAAANDALATILEADTSREVDNFVAKVTGGRPKTERRVGTGTGTGSGSGNGSITRTPTATRQSASLNTPQPPSTADSSLAPPPPIAGSYDNDARSEHSVRSTEKNESKLRSRIGTVFGRRRSSVHAGFGQLSPGKSNSYSRTSSSHGRLSPPGSASNLALSTGRLDALAEDPDTSKLPRPEDGEQAGETNGTHAEISGGGAPAGTTSSHLNGMTAEEIFDTPPPPGPPPSQLNKEGEPAKDNDGYTIPPAANDPISQAQKEAASEAGGDNEQLFRLNIQNSPIAEDDAAAAKAAQLSIANSLGLPARRAGTVRGRRDVRNTMYMPSTIPLPGAEPAASLSLSPGEPTQNLPSEPALHGASSSMSSRPSAIHTLASEASVTGTSDTQSVRSATSLGSMAHGKHPELTAPGLNSSIIESVSVTFEDGALKTVKIHGEVAFAYNGDGTAYDSRETIRINDFPSLESIGPNRIFVSSTPIPEEFILDLSHVPSKTATPGFTYRVHAEEPSSAHLASHCPLLIKPSWKPMGDKLGLVLLYKLNPGFLGGDKPVLLKGFTLVATYEGARASGVQTKPTGTHLKDKHLVYWRLGDVTLQPSEEWQKIICRVIGSENAEPKAGIIEARWEYMSSATVGEEGSHFISISRKAENKGKGKAIEEEEEESEEDDPFADDTVAVSPKTKVEDYSWREVPTVRKIVSGKYEAK